MTQRKNVHRFCLVVLQVKMRVHYATKMKRTTNDDDAGGGGRERRALQNGPRVGIP